MSRRYRLLLLLVAVLKRLSIPYRIVGSSEPQDRDSVVVLWNEPRSIYLTVTNEGVETRSSFLTMYEEELQADILAYIVMAVSDVQITE